MDKERRNRQLQIGIAIFTVSVPALISFFFFLSEKDKWELSVFHAPSIPVLNDAIVLEEEVQLFYDSISYPDLSSLKIYIKNTGNQPLTEKEFSDGPLQISILPKEEDDSQPLILKVSKITDAFQRNSILDFDNRSGEIMYMPSLLNPNDLVQLQVFLSSKAKVSLTIEGKILNGNIIGLRPYEELDRLGVFGLVDSFVSVVGNKPIAIVTTILLFGFSCLGTIGYIVLAADEESDSFLEVLGNLSFLAKVLLLGMLSLNALFITLFTLIIL